jgi:hypothetical protein
MLISIQVEGTQSSMRLLFAHHRRRFFSLLSLIPALAGVFLILGQQTAIAANPTTVNFQGKVVNSDGTNPTSTTYSFTFRIYNNSGTNPNTTTCALEATCLWEETQGSVTVTNGVFQVELGTSCSFFTSNACNKSAPIDFNTSNALYLTLKFNSDAQGYMTPLMHFQSVPYAFNADKLGGLASSAFGQLSAANSWTNTNAIAVASSSAFQVQNASNNEVLTVATNATEASNFVRLGKASTINGRLVFNNLTNSSTITLVSPSGASAPSGSITFTLPSSAPGSTQCLNSTSGGTLGFSTCATTALDNVASTAISASLLPGSGNSIDLGDATHSWRNLFIGTSVQTAASTDLALQPATGIASLNKSGIDNEFRVYENSTNGTNYASITADHTSATFKSSSGITKIGNGTGAITLNAGTGAAINITGHTTSVWQTDAGSLTIQGGTTLALLSTTSNAISLDSGNTGDVSVGTNANGKNIFIGNSSGATAASVSCGTGTCGFGNNATDHSTTLGSITGTSASTLRSGTGGATISSTSTTNPALTLSDTALVSGSALQVTVSNPQVNSNSGVLTTASVINVSSANHNYLSLTNRDLTFGGHINLSSIANIQNTYIYDTAADRDGGRWTSDERAKSSSWYNETADHNEAACVIGTDDRCGISDFPNKAILVVAGSTGSNTLYIFDAADNSLWMSFTQNAGATVAMGVSANNTISSVNALNGKIYVGTNGSASTGAYEINFVTDKITRYDGTDARDYSGNIGGRNTAQTTAYGDQLRTGMKLASSTVNDVFAQIVNGKTMFAAANGNGTAANGGISLVNESAQSVTYFEAANTNVQSVALTSDDNLYALNSTLSQVDVWYSASAKTGANILTTSGNGTIYDETTTPALWPTAPTFNTSTPDSLYITNGTSDADGQSNTIYTAHNAGLSVIEEKVGAESGGAVKYYTSSFISEELFGDIRNFLPLNGSAGVIANNTNITDSTVKANALTVKNANGTGMAYGTGVRGTAITALDNADDYICTGTTGTCADDADLDSAVASTGSFSIGAWAKRSGTGDADVIAAKWGNSTANDSYRLYYTAANVLTCDHRGAATVTISGPTSADTSSWHYYVCTFDNSNNTLKLYMDGILVAGSAGNDTNDTNDSTIAYTVGADLSGGSNAAADFFRGSIDEPYVSATALSASQVRFMYDVGYRALNNPNHAGATTIRGVSVTADNSNKLNGTSVAKAIQPVVGTGLLYIGTTGGVSVVGIDTDSLVDLYSTAITSKDDINANYDTTNGNAVNSISVSKGFGTGSIVEIGFNNAGAGGIWVETSSTGLIDFLGNSYDPFGTSLTQTNLAVDRVFRVTNQISTRLDNFSMASTNMPQIYDLMRVDSNGLTLAPGSAIVGTTIMKTTDVSGNTNFSVRAMGTNFGSLVSGGAFEGKNSYWGQEYNIAQAVAGVGIVGSTTPSACSWSRGDMGGHVLAGAACNVTSDQSNGAGDMTYSAANGTITTDTCLPSTVAGANGVERVLATAVNTASHSDVCAEYPSGGTAGASSNFLAATNLPVMAMKMKPSTLASNAGIRVFAGMWSGGKAAVATTLPGTAGGTWGAYFTNCSTTVPACSNTTWYGWVTNASTTLLGSGSTSASVTCPSTQALSTSNFAYGRIEFRTATEVHFYIDSNTSDGINEVECGTGVSSASINTGAMTPFFEAVNSNNATAATAALDVDYMRTWQDDNIDPTTLTQGTGNNVDTQSVDNNIQTIAPITPDSPDPTAQGNLFSLNAATSEDTVFNKDVYVHGTLFADKIKANQIEGLEIFTDKISGLQQKLASALDPKVSAQNTTTSKQQNVLPTSNSSLNLNVPGSLSINGPAEFHGNVLFYKLVTFTEKTLFNNDVTFAAHVITAGDTPATKLEPAAGLTKATADKPDASLAKANITGNDNSGLLNTTIGDNATTGDLLTISFSKPYNKAPQILLTPANKDAAQFKYYVNSTSDGFKITAIDPLPPSTNLQFYYWIVQ